MPRHLLVRSFADLTSSRVFAMEETSLFLDVRAATDPESRGYADHCGEHPHIMASVADFAARYNWFQQLRRALRDLSGATKCERELNVVFVCKSGKHRSVAMAFLAYHVLRHSMSYSPTQPVALGTYWGSLARCRGPTRCAACADQQSTLVLSACKQARNCWNAEILEDRT